jgi:hypothetical protein
MFIIHSHFTKKMRSQNLRFRCCSILFHLCIYVLQDVMRDPLIAADGFTYEADAIREWLDSGHQTSPMTNLELPHRDLLPNHALRSAIQEWLQTNGD